MIMVGIVSDIAVFVRKRDVITLTNQPTMIGHYKSEQQTNNS